MFFSLVGIILIFWIFFFIVIFPLPFFRKVVMYVSKALSLLFGGIQLLGGLNSCCFSSVGG